MRPAYQWYKHCIVLSEVLQDVVDGKRDRVMVFMPPRAGKQIADQTPVPTPNGWKTHGDLKIGDTVFHPSGRIINVIGISEKTPSDIQMTFSDGSEIYCHENHEWVFWNRSYSEWKTLTAKELLQKTKFGKSKQLLSGGRSIYQVETTSALAYNGQSYTMHPYVIGAWLGDGSSTKPCITGDEKDKAIISKIEKLGYPVSSICEHPVTKVLTTYFSGNNKDDIRLIPRKVVPIPGRISQELIHLGILNNKHIPESYQLLSIPLRLELLAGLVDTDGSTDKNSRIIITTVSELLARDI
ncbi:MAG: hypothetical protein NTZ48_04175, partial [Candidatus Omnitrophica bacterium]|nr:hypothetical protein [Candidatus Omnitrophota bacterium]